MFSEFDFQTVRSANEPEPAVAADESVANMQRPPVVQARVTAVINPTPPLTATVLGPVVQSGMPYRPRPRDVLATPARTLILDNHVIGSSPGAPALPLTRCLRRASTFSVYSALQTRYNAAT